MPQKLTIVLSICFCLLKISLRLLHSVPTSMITGKLLSEAKTRLQVPFYLSTFIKTMTYPKPLAIVITKKL